MEKQPTTLTVTNLTIAQKIWVCLILTAVMLITTIAYGMANIQKIPRNQSENESAQGGISIIQINQTHTAAQSVDLQRDIYHQTVNPTDGNATIPNANMNLSWSKEYVSDRGNRSKNKLDRGNLVRIFRCSAYCAGNCCCAGSADGITASGHRITAADFAPRPSPTPSEPDSTSKDMEPSNVKIAAEQLRQEAKAWAASVFNTTASTS